MMATIIIYYYALMTPNEKEDKYSYIEMIMTMMMMITTMTIILNSHCNFNSTLFCLVSLFSLLYFVFCLIS